MANDQAAKPTENTEAGADADIAAVEEFIEAGEIATLRAERDEMRDRFMRALADAENARKRGERDRR